MIPFLFIRAGGGADDAVSWFLYVKGAVAHMRRPIMAPLCKGSCLPYGRLRDCLFEFRFILLKDELSYPLRCYAPPPLTIRGGMRCGASRCGRSFAWRRCFSVRQGGSKTKKRGRKSVQRIGRRGKRRADKKPTPAGFPAGEYFALGDIQLYEAALRLSPIFIPDTSGLRCPLFSALIAVAQGIRRL